jgi:hypothetical protein
MRLEYWLSLYQCILLPICTVATVLLLYAIPVLSVYQCTLLPICTVATAVKAMCQYCGTFASKVQYVLYQLQALLPTVFNSIRLKYPPPPVYSGVLFLINLWLLVLPPNSPREEGGRSCLRNAVTKKMYCTMSPLWITVSAMCCFNSVTICCSKHIP